MHKQRAIEYDATGAISDATGFSDLQELSFANENEILAFTRDITSDVGQMLPAVAISLVTAGLGSVAGLSAAAAQSASAAASLATMGVSDAGTSTEEAYKDGADYDEGLLYGAASGAIEAGTEKLLKM